ncbi:DUF342 domain-containing protein [Planctomycetota bacterium]
MHETLAQLPQDLREIILEIEVILGPLQTTIESGRVLSVEDTIRKHLKSSEDAATRVALVELQNKLNAWFRGVFSNTVRNNTAILIALTENRDRAYLTLLPPRFSGRKWNSFEIENEIKRSSIKFGLDDSLIEIMLRQYEENPEVYFNIEIAKGSLPTHGESAGVHLTAHHLDNSTLLGHMRAGSFRFGDHIEPIKIGQVVGKMKPPTHGAPGFMVTGKRLDPAAVDEEVPALHESLTVREEDGSVFANVEGYAMLDRGKPKIIPFYEVKGDYEEESLDLNFDGNILVHGSIKGNVLVRGDDIFVEGNIEGSRIHARGDVFVKGGILGKKTGRLTTDGSVFCKFMTDVEVEALGDVVVLSSITYSNITCNGQLVVASEKGTIVGGVLAAFKGIVAKQIGSDFGTFTETIAGKDFLTTKRIETMKQRLLIQNENLKRIDGLKKRLSSANINLSNLPPEKQDIYISMLRKEKKAIEQTQSLERSIAKIDTALKEFLDASVKVLEHIHPPTRVQIGEAIRDIEECLSGVELYHKNAKIVSKEAGN